MQINLKPCKPRPLLVATVLLPLLLAGCAGATVEQSSSGEPEETVDLVWPYPPNQARIRYITTLSSEKRLRGEVGEDSNSSLKDLLLGASNAPDTDDDTVLSNPYSVHVDVTGRVFVTDLILRSLLVFDIKKKEVSTWGITKGSGELSNPMGVTSDSTGKIYVTDMSDKRIVVYDRTGKFLYAWNAGGTIERPTGIAIDEARNRVYVVDTPQDKIIVLNMQGELLTSIGTKGSEPGQFSFPVNLTIDPEGRLYVVDAMNRRIQIMEPDGTVVKIFGKHGDTYGNFSRPKGIGLDSDGNIYVVDAAFSNIQIFNQEGKVLLSFGEGGSGHGEFQLPAGLFIFNDRIYIADSVNRRIQVFQYLKAQPGQ